MPHSPIEQVQVRIVLLCHASQLCAELRDQGSAPLLTVHVEEVAIGVASDVCHLLCPRVSRQPCNKLVEILSRVVGHAN